jgi:hypothetical protein
MRCEVQVVAGKSSAEEDCIVLNWIALGAPKQFNQLMRGTGMSQLERCSGSCSLQGAADSWVASKCGTALAIIYPPLVPLGGIGLGHELTILATP